MYRWDRTSIDTFLSDLSSTAPAPGGGASGAIVGAIGCAQAEMAAAVSLKNKTVRKTPERVLTLEHALETFVENQKQLLSLANADACAYECVCHAQNLPKNTEEEAEVRAKRLEDALLIACKTCFSTLECVTDVLAQIRASWDACATSIKSDYVCAATQLLASAECANATVLANIHYMKSEEDISQVTAERLRLLATARLDAKYVLNKNSFCDKYTRPTEA